MAGVHELELAPSPPRADGPKLRLHVIYTSPETTRVSLGIASVLAHDLGATLELLVARVVPYPLPLNSPTAPASFTEEFLSVLVSECGVDVDVKVLLCRDREETIPQWLPAESIVVIGSRRRWGPGSFRGLIRMVRRRGHHVIVVNAEGKILAPATFCRRRRSR
jgi:hypothetical protein